MHVAWTYDQNTMLLYLNGQPIATNVIGPHPIATSDAHLRLSGDDNGNVMFDGLIDEATIYDRALSPGEIAAIYDAGSAGKCLPSPTLAPGISGTNFCFSVPTISNLIYTIQQNTDLATTNWVFYTNFTGNGSLFQFVTPILNIPRQFFRVSQ